MKEVFLYKKLTSDQVQCGVCSHRCQIKSGFRGLCDVRENRSGQLFALNYGKTIAVAIDPIEKKPLYHFMPKTETYSFATVGCNFRCAWCQNWDISQSPKPKQPILGDDISPAEHLKAALEYDCPSISYTYTEPTIFLEYAFDTMKLAKKNNLKNIWVSNGYMTPETLKIILPYLDAINVDLKTFSDQTYQQYCGAKLAPILENLQTIAKSKIHLEITTLIIPGINDSQKELKQITQFIVQNLGDDIPWHISRFFPAWKIQAPITPLKTLQLAESIGKKAGLKYVHVGNV